MARDARSVAPCFALGTAAAIGFVAPAAFVGVGDDVAVEGRAAFAAVGYATEQEGGVDAAGMAASEPLGVVFHDSLHGAPGLRVYNGFAVAFVGLAAVFQDANIDGVAEKGGVGVEGTVEVQFFVDAGNGHAGGAHFKGAADEGNEVGVGRPAVADVF